MLIGTFVARDKIVRPSFLPGIMGVLNITPDSFYDGGKYIATDKAIARALFLEEAGAEIIDIGAESTRPGSDYISADEQIERILPVLKGLKGRISCPISVDTRLADVAEMALRNGASIINDVSALRDDPDIVQVISKYKAAVVLMHMRGEPKTMQNGIVYNDIIADIKKFLKSRIDYALDNNVEENSIIIDPGIGFGKRLEDNLAILANIDQFSSLNCVILIGASRKSFINMLDGSSVENRIGGSLAAVAAAQKGNVHWIRVHDVAETKQFLTVASAIGGKQFSNCTSN